MGSKQRLSAGKEAQPGFSQGQEDAGMVFSCSLPCLCNRDDSFLPGWHIGGLGPEPSARLLTHPLQQPPYRRPPHLSPTLITATNTFLTSVNTIAPREGYTGNFPLASTTTYRKASLLTNTAFIFTIETAVNHSLAASTPAPPLPNTLAPLGGASDYSHPHCLS